jgi:hypothetical protein
MYCITQFCTIGTIVLSGEYSCYEAIDMLLSAVSVLVVAQSSSEIPEGLMNDPVYRWPTRCTNYCN